jgi:hypothetical protein
MIKKFKNLGREEDTAIGGINGLSNFITKPDRQVVKRENPIIKENKPIEEKKDPVTPGKKTVEKKKLEKEATKKIPKKEEVKMVKIEPNKDLNITTNVLLPEDFKSHSALFSEDQLNKLRSVVNYLKWKENPKFTIQAAIFQGIEMLMNNRVVIDNFPDDFMTYSPSFSENQRERLGNFVGEIRYKSNPKYALKYAIFEAIQIFLDAYPIDE